MRLHGVRVADLSPGDEVRAAGEPPPVLLSAPTVATAEPLWQLLLQRGRDVTVAFESPKLVLAAGDSGTNVEATLSELFGRVSADSDANVPIRLRVRNGEMTVTTSTASAGGADARDAPVVIRELNGEVTVSPGAGDWPTFELSGRVDESKTGSPRDDDGRIEPPASAGPPGAPADDEGRQVASPSRESQSRPATPGLAAGAFHIRCRPAIDSESGGILHVACQQVRLMPLRPLLNIVDPGLMCRGEISGEADLALAGRNLTDGVAASLQVTGSRLGLRRRGWAAEEWLDLGATDGGGTLIWGRDGLEVDGLRMRCDVGELEGSGRLSTVPPENQRFLATRADIRDPDVPDGRVVVSGHADAARVVSMLRGTLAVHDDLQFERARVEFAFQAGQDAAPAITATNDADAAAWQAWARLDQVRALRGGRPLDWSGETRLDARGGLSGGLVRLAEIGLTLPGGRLSVQPQPDGHRVTGLLEPETLWSRVRQFAAVRRPGITGPVELNASFRVRDQTFDIRNLRLTSRDLTVRADQFLLHRRPGRAVVPDGTLHLNGSGTAVRTVVAPWHNADWLAPQSELELHLTTVPQQTFRILAELQPAPERAARRRTDVAAAAPRDARTPPRGRLAAIDTRTNDASGFLIDRGRLALELRPDLRAERVEVVSGHLEIPGLTALPTGSIAMTDGELLLDLDVSARYDLEALTTRLWPRHPSVRLAGQGQHAFRITGSPTRLRGRPGESAATAQGAGGLSRVLAVSGGLGWDSGQLYGLRIGPARVEGTLDEGIVRAQPVDCSVESGSLHVMPRVDLVDRRLQLATGSRLQRMRLSPELCRDWVSYATPLLSNTTQISGLVSARVDHFDVSWIEPRASTASGQLTVHHAEADPDGALLAALRTVDLIRASGRPDRSSVVRSIRLPEQSLPVSLRNGVIRHEGLQLEVGDYQIRSSGDVHLDRTVRIMVDVPLEKTRGNDDVRILRVPVGGTLDNLQPDTDALLRDLGRSEIDDRVNRELDRQLNKLLDKLR